MDLVERYIAAVQRELPQAKRDEIGRELNANIMDQLDALAEQQGELTDTDIANVLREMGHPRSVAEQFVPPQPLISLGYMPLYKNTLFMVLGILFVLHLVEVTTLWLSTANMGLIRYGFALFGGFVDEACFGFTSITLAYWLMSRQQPAANAGCSDKWQPEKLPPAGPGWQHIKLQDIFTDLASYIFLLVVIWYPLYMSAEQLAQSALLLSSNVRLILQYSTPLIVLGIVHSLWQLQQRLWSRSMLASHVLLNATIAVIALYLASTSPLLQLNTERWYGVFNLQQLERSAMITLVIIALFPAWEALRDSLRLRKLK
ncbi:HAAS signaling domain-containing protein [Rheinheimera gaetbuli]